MTLPRMRRGERASFRSFYDLALSEAEREDLASALEVEGIDLEVALLRLKLREVIEQGDPEEFRLLQAGVGLLIRALLAQRRLSPAAAGDLSESMANLLEQAGGWLQAWRDA